MKQETVVLIVGAGPAGLATSACLNLKNIPNIVLEKEDCCASLWKKRSYDRMKLHLAKEFCELPSMPFPPSAPTFVPKHSFIRYLDDYVSHYKVAPFYHREVESASFDGKWTVVAKNTLLDRTEEYVVEFLVVASGENSQGFVPQIPGLDSFSGDVLHSSDYRNGKKYENRDVLVVGSGNSGMELAFDLWNWGAHASIVARSPVHILTKMTVQVGMVLLKYVPLNIVDNFVVMLSKLKYGNLSDYGIQRPDKGPFYLKMTTGRSPVIDVGTIDKIRSREIKVFPSKKTVDGNHVHFTDGSTKTFDSMVFATGYKSTVAKWLKDDGALFSANGMPKMRAPDHWKGKNGLYCSGFSRSGLFGISNDASVVFISEILDNTSSAIAKYTYHTTNCNMSATLSTINRVVIVAMYVQDDGALFSANGMPKMQAPDHWKGKNGLYCAGFSRSGLFGISNDARAIAHDINALLSHEN